MECPKCKSTKVNKVGKVPSYKDGKKQRFMCRDCAKTFYETKEVKTWKEQ